LELALEHRTSDGWPAVAAVLLHLGKTSWLTARHVEELD
jgi:hypothetical protein